VLCTAKGKASPALSLEHRLTRDIAIPWIREIVTIWAPNPSGSYTAVSVSFLGHFLWVTFDAKLVPWDLLGQQEKSDSAAGRQSKRPLRKRPDRGAAASNTEVLDLARQWITNQKSKVRTPPNHDAE